MRPKDRVLAGQLDAALNSFDGTKHRLPGIHPATNRGALLEQLVESIHRIRYLSLISARPVSPLRADPSSDLFDPLRAAVLSKRQGQVDEAFWFVFLSVHFGKNKRTGWRLTRDVYGALGAGTTWNWSRVSSRPHQFRQWLAAHQATLRGGDGVARHFGNHRKYQSLGARSPTGTGAAVESYVQWIGPPNTHHTVMQGAITRAAGNPRRAFDELYRSMGDVVSFGRTARFDYLTMVGKLGLAQIEPGSTFMQGATGPLMGARLLFGGRDTAAALDAKLVELDEYLGLAFGMQVLEDALCNWQKSPTKFVPFRG